jgi:hypothetical protein
MLPHFSTELIPHDGSVIVRLCVISVTTTGEPGVQHKLQYTTKLNLYTYYTTDPEN